MHQKNIVNAILTAAMLAGFCIGCAKEQATQTDEKTSGHLSPQDFHTDTPARPMAVAETASTSQSDASATTSTSPAPLPAPNDKTNEWTVDAMVGQVNGKPIYASAIFKGIGEEQLERLGQSQPRLVFRSEAERLIYADLRSRVTNAMILAEAERGLSEREQLGLLGYLKQEREKILANFGAGVAAKAEDELMKEKGHGIADELEARRQQLLTQKYLRERLYPKIYVTRQEVERYYNDHYDEFNPKPTVTLRVLIVRDEKTADKVDAALAAGDSFEKVTDEYGIFRAPQAGLMDPQKLDGKLSEANLLSWPQLNKKIQSLSVGQHTDRTKIDPGYGWVALEKLEGGEKKSLQDVYLRVEAGLRDRKFNTLSRKYTEKLLENGNYTPIQQMGSALLDVAMTRYARPQ
ncbi:hypothetical protein HED60_00250 [Planctomycetales bacterium ZRK34]|nr:hypothetical protein HED60_00250 [Planctomycetales bacterium ZRK34]